MKRRLWTDAILDIVQLTTLWIALIFAIVAVGAGLYEASFLHRAAAATGTVLSMDVHEDVGENGAMAVFYAPVFTFNVAGHEVTVHSNTAGSEDAYRVGQTVRVRYLAEAPEHAQIENAMQEWALAIGFGVAAIACGMVGGVLRLRRGACGFPSYLFQPRGTAVRS